MYLQRSMEKVSVVNAERSRLDKWAIDTCNGKKIREIIKLSNGTTEVIYRFPSTELRESFLNGLNANFGSTVKVLSRK